MRFALLVVLLLEPVWAAVGADITNLAALRLNATQNPKESFSIHLAGDVWWANPAQNEFVIKDGSGVEEVQMDLRGVPVKAGQTVELTGRATIMPSGANLRLGPLGPVVDNDGVHIMVEKSGSVYLTAGRNPFRLEWFNGVEKYGLKVEFEGPGLPRGQIPDNALFRGADGGENGLDYVCVEAPSEMLPDFDLAAPLKRGTTTNLDLSVITQPERVALCFTGFLNVPRDGSYTFYTTSDDGSRLFVGRPMLQLTITGQAALPAPQIGGPWTQLEGKATFVSRRRDGVNVELSAPSGRAEVEIADPAGLDAESLLNHRIRATGYHQKSSGGEDAAPGRLLVPSAREIVILPSAGEAPSEMTNRDGLPVLVTAAEIHRLKREEAERHYPVKLRGVVTSEFPERQAFTLQDGTRGLYVIDYSESRTDRPRIGEFLEVEGMTGSGEFAPIVVARHVESLGRADLPEPVHPTRDQLMNGSLDAQYVELQGILTDVQSNGVILLTPDGRIRSELRPSGLELQDLKAYEDALVRVRGCLFATWNYITHQVKVGEIRIYGADINVEQPAPANLFLTPRKRAADLSLFDPQASVFQRVMVSGQIIHVRQPDCFLMDGASGVRFVAKNSERLEVGDLVDIVGFPELSSGLPVLREAVARKTGHAPLPMPRELGVDGLTHSELDATLVRIKATLVNERSAPGGQALEMRVGLRSFLALLPAPGVDIRDVPLGSQVELAGAYASQGIGQDAASFGLLLNSPADITVLARPPWWTLGKLFVILGALACVLAFSALWITQLRRKVGQRTAELEVQIRERQRAEQQHAMEQERARIAQDLHDELGSGLTEISMLGIRAKSESAPAPAKGSYLEQMSGKARQMVTALDEIVWAMNPTHDSLESMVSYFSLYAERFLGLAGIAWRLEDGIGPVDYALDSRRRHQLFLAFKEALTNIVRHSGATEVTLAIKVEQNRLRLAVADNGRGLNDGDPQDGMDGVANMQARLAKLGGRSEVSGKTGIGTRVQFDLPLQ